MADEPTNTSIDVGGVDVQATPEDVAKFIKENPFAYPTPDWEGTHEQHFANWLRDNPGDYGNPREAWMDAMYDTMDAGVYTYGDESHLLPESHLAEIAQRAAEAGPGSEEHERFISRAGWDPTDWMSKEAPRAKLQALGDFRTEAARANASREASLDRMMEYLGGDDHVARIARMYQEPMTLLPMREDKTYADDKGTYIPTGDYDYSEYRKDGVLHAKGEPYYDYQYDPAEERQAVMDTQQDIRRHREQVAQRAIEAEKNKPSPRYSQPLQADTE